MKALSQSLRERSDAMRAVRKALSVLGVKGLAETIAAQLETEANEKARARHTKAESVLREAAGVYASIASAVTPASQKAWHFILSGHAREFEVRKRRRGSR
jgi:hypothetical protein